MSKRQDEGKWLLVALVLLILVVGGASWFVLNPPDLTPTDDNVAVTIADPEPEPTPEPDPEPEPEPDPEPAQRAPQAPEPEPEPTGPAHVELPDMSRFSHLVLEADVALALREGQEPNSTEAWQAYSVLHQLASRFQHHALRTYRGVATEQEHSDFRSDVNQAFLRPDTHSPSYRTDSNLGVKLWYHEGARFPPPDTAGAPNLLGYASMRPHEAINAPRVSAWLRAIEAEFGTAGFGTEHPDLDIVVFADHEVYLDFSAKRFGLRVPGWSAGYYSTAWQLVGMPVSQNFSNAEVIRHELFHAVQDRLAPQSLLVPWFTEGTAEWLSKVPPVGTRLRADEAFNNAAWGHLRVFFDREAGFDLLQFLTMDTARFYANPRLNYLLAYCWVDFVRSEPELLSLYHEFWSLMVDGMSHTEALERTFLKLDLEHWARMFRTRAYAFAPQDTPPRFTPEFPPVSATEQAPGLSRQAEIPEIWRGRYDRLMDLGLARFAPPLSDRQDIELLIVAIDNSTSMQEVIVDPDFDWDSFARWQFALRFAHSIDFRVTRVRDSVPNAVRLSLIEAALTDRLEEFTQASSIRVAQGTGDNIMRHYNEAYAFKPDKLVTMTRLELAQHAAESIAMFTTSHSGRERVTIIPFNTSIRVEHHTKGTIRRSEWLTGNPLLGGAFEQALRGERRGLANGADCDWWAPFEAARDEAENNRQRRVALLFITDSFNTAGRYGVPFPVPNDPEYRKRQTEMVEAMGQSWLVSRELPRPGNVDPIPIHMVGLPGADVAGLAAIRQQFPNSDLEYWPDRFRRLR